MRVAALSGADRRTRLEDGAAGGEAIPSACANPVRSRPPITASTALNTSSRRSRSVHGAGPIPGRGEVRSSTPAARESCTGDAAIDPVADRSLFGSFRRNTEADQRNDRRQRDVALLPVQAQAQLYRRRRSCVSTMPSDCVAAASSQPPDQSQREARDLLAAPDGRIAYPLLLVVP